MMDAFSQQELRAMFAVLGEHTTVIPEATKHNAASREDDSRL
jgi:hypothetical protein